MGQTHTTEANVCQGVFIYDGQMLANESASSIMNVIRRGNFSPVGLSLS